MFSKEIMKSSLLLLAGLSFLFSGCGNEGTYTAWDRLYPEGISGFRVMFSIPEYDAIMVPTNSNIIVRLNEPVDPSSMVEGSIRVEQTANGVFTDITKQGTLSTQNNGYEIIWSPNPGSPLVYGAFYQMMLTPMLKSTAGRPLVAMTYVPFTTGDNSYNGLGVFSVPGAPTVENMNLQGYDGIACMSVNIRFNEDLSIPPVVRYEIDALFGLYTQFQGYMAVSANPYSLDGRTFIADFPGGACDWNIDVGTRIDVTVESAVDLQGQHMEGSYSDDLYAIGMIF